jgi:hypothetical protein
MLYVCVSLRAESKGEEGTEAWELRRTARAHHLPPSPLPPPFCISLYTYYT